DVQKRQRIQTTVPDVVHHTTADAGHAILAAEAEALLKLWMKPVKVRTQNLAINRTHWPSCFFLLHRRAVGRSPELRSAIVAKATTARFNVTGLKAATRYPGA